MSKRTSRRREMERMLAVREREGISLRELAERFDVPVGTLSWWSHQLRKGAQPAFAEVRVASSDPAGPVPGVTGSLRLLFPGGVVAEFDGELAVQVSQALLEKLVRWS